MGWMGDWIECLKPGFLMVMVQVAFAGVNIFYKLAANDGMNLKIVVAYRFIFATIFMVPLALVYERNSRPKLTWIVVLQAFLCGLFGGTLAQNLYIESLVLTSATFASAMSNLVPALTFILAITFGLERLGLGSFAGKAKLVGTFIGIGGAMLLTFYKGPEIHMWSTHFNLLHRHTDPRQLALPHPKPQFGSLLAIASCFSYAIWLIIQAKMGARYPCPYSSTALMSVMGSIQGVVYALCMEKDWNQWKLGWNIRLLTVAFSGIIASGLMVTLIAWAVRKKGPLFVSIFNPVMLVIVAVAGSLLLDEALHLGSILGGALIVCGLYFVLWGKSKEINQLFPSSFRVADDSLIQLSAIITATESDDDTVLSQIKSNTVVTIRDLLEKEKEKEQEIEVC